MKDQMPEEKKKGFFAKLFEKLDKKLEDKSKRSGCCCSSNKDDGTDSPSIQYKGNQCCPSRPSKNERKDLGGDSCCS